MESSDRLEQLTTIVAAAAAVALASLASMISQAAMSSSSIEVLCSLFSCCRIWLLMPYSVVGKRWGSDASWVFAVASCNDCSLSSASLESVRTSATSNMSRMAWERGPRSGSAGCVIGAGQGEGGKRMGIRVDSGGFIL